MTLVLLIGCSAAPAPRQAAVASTKPASDASRDLPPMVTEAEQPFYIHEAKLPAGFPGAGPIGVVRLKHYPAYRAALVRSSELEGANQDAMFRRLFDHLQKQKLAMTCPVEMGFRSDAAQGGENARPQSMSLIYASPAVGAKQDDGPVHVIDLPAVTVLSVGVRGSYGPESFQVGMSSLQRYFALHSEVCRVVGAPRFLGYNSPFVPPFWRYGEVQIPVMSRSP